MTLQQLINNLTWYDLIRKLKVILLQLSGGSAPTYKVYTAMLTQVGTNAPIATVVENTLGFVPTYSYVSPGFYTSPNSEWQVGLDNSKIRVFFSLGNRRFATNFNNFGAAYHNIDSGGTGGRIEIKSLFNTLASNDVISNGDLESNSTIEIRMYN